MNHLGSSTETLTKLVDIPTEEGKKKKENLSLLINYLKNTTTINFFGTTHPFKVADVCKSLLDLSLYILKNYKDILMYALRKKKEKRKETFRGEDTRFL